MKSPADRPGFAQGERRHLQWNRSNRQERTARMVCMVVSSTSVSMPAPPPEMPPDPDPPPPPSKLKSWRSVKRYSSFKERLSVSIDSTPAPTVKPLTRSSLPAEKSIGSMKSSSSDINTRVRASTEAELHPARPYHRVDGLDRKPNRPAMVHILSSSILVREATQKSSSLKVQEVMSELLSKLVQV